MDVRAASAVLLSAALNAAAATNDFTAIGPNGGTVNQLAYSRNGAAAFMVSVGGFYRSQDAGVSWTNIKSDFFAEPSDVAIDPADATRLYVAAPGAPSLFVSNDGGTTLKASTGLPAAVTEAQHVAVSHDGATLYLSSRGRIFSSTNRGQSWQERTAISSDSGTSLQRLLVDPSDAATVYAAAATATTDNAGIFVSRDGAASWSQVTSGSEETSLTQDLAINPANPAQVWAAGYDGIWVSADHGTHWSIALSGAMFAVATDPSNPLVVYAGSAYGKLYRSGDAGSSWSDVTGSNIAGGNPHLAVNPAHANQVLAGGEAGVAGSANSGTSWTAQQAGYLATSVDGLSADPATDRIYAQARDNGVFYTTSGGTSLQAVNNAALFALEPAQPAIDVTSILAQPGRLFASVSTGLTFSTDGGATWGPPIAALPPLPGTQEVFTLASAPGPSSTILATGYGPVRRSVDRGATWSTVNGLPANSIATKILIAPSDPATVYGSFYLPTMQTTLLGVYKSVDAGANWAPINGSTPVSPTYALAVDPRDARIAYANNLSFSATSSGGLLKTVDGGAHWSVLPWDPATPSSAPQLLAIDPLHPNIIYGAGGRFARSVDGGATWESLPNTKGQPSAVGAMLADPHRPENLLVATAGAGVQQITIAPDLALSVAGPPGQLGIGTVASYTYTATNLGPFDATGVTVTVQLPAAAQNVTAAVGSGTGSCSVSAAVATCTFPIVRKSASSTLTVTAIAPGSGAFDLSAAVSGEQPDPDLSSNTVSTSATAVTLSDLSVTATGSATATVGDTVSYTVVANNAGPNAAPAAQLTIQLPAGLTPGTVSSPDATCTMAAGTVSCDLGSFAASETATVTVTATAASAGALVSNASISSGATDPTAANNAASASTSVSAPAAPPASGHGGGGGELSALEVAGLLSLLAARRGRPRRPPALGPGLFRDSRFPRCRRA